MSRTVVGEGSRDSRGTYDLLESVLSVWHHPGYLCSASNMPGVPFLFLAHAPESIRTMNISNSSSPNTPAHLHHLAIPGLKRQSPVVAEMHS